MRDPVVDQEGDLWIVHKVLGLHGLGIRGHDDHRAVVVVGGQEGVIHQRDVRCRLGRLGGRDGCQV